MKRNIDLIRLLLLNQEALSPNSPDISEEYSADLRAFSNDERVYNTYLLINGGFLSGMISLNGPGGSNGNTEKVDYCKIGNITWKGQEFLTVLRNKASFETLKKGLNNGMTIDSFMRE